MKRCTDNCVLHCTRSFLSGSIPSFGKERTFPLGPSPHPHAVRWKVPLTLLPVESARKYTYVTRNIHSSLHIYIYIYFHLLFLYIGKYKLKLIQP